MPGFRPPPEPTPAIGGPHSRLAIAQQPPKQSRTSNQRARSPHEALPIGVHRHANQNATSRPRHQCDTGGQPGNRLPFHRCFGGWHRCVPLNQEAGFLATAFHTIALRFANCRSAAECFFLDRNLAAPPGFTDWGPGAVCPPRGHAVDLNVGRAVGWRTVPISSRVHPGPWKHRGDLEDLADCDRGWGAGRAVHRLAAARTGPITLHDHDF